MNSKFRYWMSLLSLGFMGGTIYVIPYIRYVFYDQMVNAMGVTNVQIGLMSTVYSLTYSLTSIPGSFIADKIDAKKTIVISIAGTTALTFLYGFFCSSYTMALIVWVLLGFSTGCAYWPSLIKYINNLGTADEAGKSFSTYYLINGLSGALANAIPLWISTKLGFVGAIHGIGVVTLIATFLVVFFLESEATKKARGEIMVGDEDEGIKVKDIKYVLTYPAIYMLMIITTCAYALNANLSYFNPYMIDVFGVDPEASSLISIIRSYAVTIASPIGGYMADKVFKSSAKWFICAFSIIGVMLAVVYLFNENTSIVLVSIYSVLPSFVVMALYTVQYSVLRELHIHPALVGTTIGLSGIIPFTDGVLPPIFGWCMDNFPGAGGYYLIFGILILMCVIGILTSFWVISHDKKCKAGLRENRIG